MDRQLEGSTRRIRERDALPFADGANEIFNATRELGERSNTRPETSVTSHALSTSMYGEK